MNSAKRSYSIILVFALCLVLTSFVSAIETNLSYSSSSIVQIKSLKYEPYPVNPGEYFDFWINVQYTQDPGSSGAIFELIPEFPFSLDDNQSAVQSFGKLSAPSIVLKYKVRVDEDAVSGVNKLKVKYQVFGNWYTKEFDIEVANAQTSFDAVIQDATSSEVSIAIANTGKNTANSVIVKIPEQDNFESTGTDGQMVGNLDSGDYSIVSFELSQKRSQQAQPSSDAQSSNTGFPAMASSTEAKNFSFDIYYTDNIGERRKVTLQLPLSLESSSNSSIAGFGPGMRQQRSSNLIWYVVGVVVAVLGIVFVILWKKFPDKTKKFLTKLNPKNLFKKKNNQKTDVPEWVKKAKEKEKSK